MMPSTINPRWLCWLLLGCVMCGALGCTRTGPYVPKSEAPTVEDQYAVVLMDYPLKQKVAVERWDGWRLVDDRLEARATIRNRTRGRLHVQVQTVFKDAAGFSLEEDSAWQDLILTPKETQTYSCKSLKSEAQAFNIRIRLPR